MIDYNGKTFRPLTNSEAGEVGSDTIFHYSQNGNIVTGTYSGGAIQYGQLIALVDSEGRLDMRYQHINAAGELLTGVCVSAPHILSDGKLQLHETWQWTSGKEGTGYFCY